YTRPRPPAGGKMIALPNLGFPRVGHAAHTTPAKSPERKVPALRDQVRELRDWDPSGVKSTIGTLETVKHHLRPNRQPSGVPRHQAHQACPPRVMRDTRPSGDLRQSRIAAIGRLRSRVGGQRLWGLDAH